MSTQPVKIGQLLLRPEDEMLKEWDYLNPLVTVCCITYNQEKYIANTLESFLIQKTNFPFEIIVHDDASSDNTAKIIRQYEEKYPNIIKPIYQTENQYSKKSNLPFVIAFGKASGKYIAVCEGDDYWIDPFKLQKQADYLKANPKCSMCCHRAYVLDCKENKMVRNSMFRHNMTRRYYIRNAITRGNAIPLASMMFRSKLACNLPDFFLNASIGDWTFTIYCALDGYIYNMKSYMSVYRADSRINEKRETHYSKEFIINQQRLVSEMLKEINIFTNYKYDKTIKKTILNHEYNILKKHINFEDTDDYYKSIHNNMTLKFKIKLFLIKKCPRINKLCSVIIKRIKVAIKKLTANSISRKPYAEYDSER